MTLTFTISCMTSYQNYSRQFNLSMVLNISTKFYHQGLLHRKLPRGEFPSTLGAPKSIVRIGLIWLTL